jgi:hypothetical protein
MQKDLTTDSRGNCQSPKKVAAAVACSVTVQASQCHWVARNGSESLFALLEAVLPQVFSVVHFFSILEFPNRALAHQSSAIMPIDSIGH